MITDLRPGSEPLFTPWDQEAPQWSGFGAESLADQVTGGAITRLEQKAQRIEAALKTSTIASIVAGGAALLMLFRR